jgi:hypothetical protein
MPLSTAFMTAVSGLPAPSRPRDLRLDFFRGAALMFIFVDHIPENVLSNFTLMAVGFYDAAEVFIFVSGFTAAMVYGRALAAKGALYATAQVLRRAWQLYVAHVFLFVIFIAEVSYTVMTFNNPMYNEEMRVGDFLQEPHVAVVKALLLQFQPTFLDILPLYIVLLTFFPLVLLGLRLRTWLVLIPSFLLYLAVQAFGLEVPAYPEGHSWYFNPLAWQFLFIAGAAMGLSAIEERPRAAVPSVAVAAALAVFGAALVVKLSWTIHGVWEAFPGLLLRELWPVNKTNLSPVRLVPFFALVLVVGALVPPRAAFLRSALARPLVLCGQQSLQVFCLGIVLSALAHFVLTEYEGGVLAQIAITVAGIAVMCLTARMIDWYRTLDRAPVAATAVAGRRTRRMA